MFNLLYKKYLSLVNSNKLLNLVNIETNNLLQINIQIKKANYIKIYPHFYLINYLTEL